MRLNLSLQPHLEPSGDLPAVRHLVVLPSHFIAGLPVELFAPQGIRISYAPSGSLLTYLRQLPKPKSAGVLAVGDPVFRQRKPKDETEPHAMRDQRELGRWLAALRSGAETFAPLPGTFVEVKRIQALFQSTQQPHEVFVRTQASEPKLVELARGDRLKQYRYLHFATHGVINDQRPTRSALILSQVGLPNPAEQFDKGLPIFDSRLTVEEITEQWELNADLVTLSACETALGRYTRGEGHIGFAQALLAAGARSVVLSLWKVDDTAATLLMDRFYTNLLGRRDGLSAPMPKAEALTEAKTWLRDLSKPQASKLVAQVHTDLERGKGRVERPAPAINPSQPSEKRRGLSGDRPFAHPYYWAAFILIGDPN